MEKTEERVYVVDGMTCGHCKASVTEEVSSIEGVVSVDVDLTTKRVTVRGEELEDHAIRRAIAEAGYEAAT